MFPFFKDDQPRAFPLHSSARSTGSVDSPTSLKKKEPGIALAATFTANNRWAASLIHPQTISPGNHQLGWLPALLHSGSRPASLVSYLLIWYGLQEFHPPTHWDSFFHENCQKSVWVQFGECVLKHVSVTVMPWGRWSEKRVAVAVLILSHRCQHMSFSLFVRAELFAGKTQCAFFTFSQEQQGSCGKLCHNHLTQQLLWEAAHA